MRAAEEHHVKGYLTALRYLVARQILLVMEAHTQGVVLQIFLYHFGHLSENMNASMYVLGWACKDYCRCVFCVRVGRLFGILIVINEALHRCFVFQPVSFAPSHMRR